LIVFISTPVELTLLVLFAQRRDSAAGYLGFTLPRRGDVVFGVIAVVILIVAWNVLSWLLGQAIVTSFQLDLYRTASAAGWLPWLWLAVVVVTPVGEESLFRGFLFRGWLRSPRDAWPVIVVSALLWGLLHVQYDWYVMPQLFALGILLGWLRWCSGSTLLTMLLHGLINFEGMVETYLDLKWLT
jgi:membrane protease YdiL (CAAX protease family)